jgi:hypothetical protein
LAEKRLFDFSSIVHKKAGFLKAFVSKGLAEKMLFDFPPIVHTKAGFLKAFFFQRFGGKKGFLIFPNCAHKSWTFIKLRGLTQTFLLVAGANLGVLRENLSQI